jgi:simple sugar transport system permease protein
MDFLYGIPVLGLVFQFVGYLVDALINDRTLGEITVRLAAPIALGALCGILNERSGVVNIGIEGMMLTSAFAAFMAALVVSDLVPTDPSPIFGVTPALLVGILVAIAVGVLVSLLHAWLSITIRADQIISGTIINIAALGLTGYINRVLKPLGSYAIFQGWEPPGPLGDLPVIGWILNQGPLAMSVIVLVIVLQVLLFRSRWGLRTRAVGEHPKAADTVGINVIALRYRNVLLGGVFAGLAGAYLTLESNGSFQNGMTAGRGFIALAAVIFGRWTPLGAYGGALLFMFSQALGVAIRSNPPTGELGTLLAGWQADFPSIYNNIFSALPYLLTIIILAGVVGRSIAPAAVGRPYEKEAHA